MRSYNYIFTALFFICFLAFTSFGAGSTYAADMPKESASDSHTSVDNPAPYVLGPGDKIEITVYGERDLSSTYTVSGAGKISFPLIGQVQGSGQTLSAVENTITKKLKDGYLRAPSVSIQITEYRPFYILGEVRNPGSYSFVAEMSILNAVAMAGGYTYRADKDELEVLRSQKGQREVMRDMKSDAIVHPGDIILVKESFF